MPGERRKERKKRRGGSAGAGGWASGGGRDPLTADVLEDCEGGLFELFGAPVGAGVETGDLLGAECVAGQYLLQFR